VAVLVLVTHTTLNGSGSVWDALTAVGTVGASVVAIWLGYRGIRQERTAVAGLVSAWVSDDYQPDFGTQSYRRTVLAHIANESAEPVFDVHAVVVIGFENAVRLGPLSVPDMPVLAQRREQVFDLTVPMLAHDNTWNPRIELSFTDSHGRRWRREVDGVLHDISNEPATWVAGQNDERQLGRMDDVNPMGVALGFLAALRADPLDVSQIALTLAPEAAWAGTDWAALNVELAAYQPTSMVDYPAPFIAHVKLAEGALEGMAVAGDRMPLRVKIITLTFTPMRGWRVWGVGLPVRPDQIQFPPGTWT
jgi:hypothetical protein